LADGRPPELGALYDDCNECAASTFFTAFYYDRPHHMWTTRWMRGGQGALAWTDNSPAGVALTQVYAVLNEPNGREVIGTWSHFDYGKLKPAEDVVYRYDLDPYSKLERTQLLSGKEAEAMKQRLCGAPECHSRFGAGARPGLGALPADGAASLRTQARHHPAGQQPRPLRAARRAALNFNPVVVNRELFRASRFG
jgi:hypothetical protein